MSREGLGEFLEQLGQSEELQARIGDDVDIESLVALGIEQGLDINKDDFNETAELTDEELDGVAGGLIAVVIITALKEAKGGNRTRWSKICDADAALRSGKASGMYIDDASSN